MPTRSLDDLSSDFRPPIFQLLGRLVERGGAWQIICCLRTQAEHEQNLRNGRSWTALSKHLPRTLRGVGGMTLDANKSDAIDLCPFSQWLEFGEDKLQWSADDPQFAVLGDIAERLGFRWGGRWSKRDMGHVELLFPGEKYDDIPKSSAAWQDHGVHP